MKTNKPIIGLLVLLACLLMMTSACGKKFVHGVSGSADLSSSKVNQEVPGNMNNKDLSGDPLVQLEETLLGDENFLGPADGRQAGAVEALSAADLYDDKGGTLVAGKGQETWSGFSSLPPTPSSSTDRSSATRRGPLGAAGMENSKGMSRAMPRDQLAVSGRSSDYSVTDAHKNWSTQRRGVHFSHGLQDIFFAYDSWRLSEKSHQILESNAEWLKAHPHERISIAGHCDERGTRAYNYVLGEKRAAMVKQYLSHLGVPSEQMVVASFGKDRPACRVFTTACFQANRRAHFATDMNMAARD